MAQKIKAETQGSTVCSNNQTCQNFLHALELYKLLRSLLIVLCHVFQHTGTKLKDFVAAMKSDANVSEISKLRHEVEEYAKQFPTIGFEKETMKYTD